MSTSKLKLNPDKTEFIVNYSKRQRDKLKAYFPTTILGSPLCPAEAVKNLGVWFNSDFTLSKHVQNVCNTQTITHFPGVSLTSIFVNYSASKIVQLELYEIPVDTLVYLALASC